MRVFVIGASGFIGRKVAQALLADRYAVRCLARNPSRVQDWAKTGCEMVYAKASLSGNASDSVSLMDAVNWRILAALQQDSRVSMAELGAGVIQGYRAVVSPAAPRPSCSRNFVRYAAFHPLANGVEGNVRISKVYSMIQLARRRRDQPVSTLNIPLS